MARSYNDQCAILSQGKVDGILGSSYLDHRWIRDEPRAARCGKAFLEPQQLDKIDTTYMFLYEIAVCHVEGFNTDEAEVPQAWSLHDSGIERS